MFKYFDKTFFKFLGGFVAILALSLVVFLVAGYYDTKAQSAKTPATKR